MRSQAHDAHITELTQKGDEIRIVMYEKAQIDTTRIDGLLKFYRGRLRFTIEMNPYFTYARPKTQAFGKESESILQLVQELLAVVRTLSG